MKSVFAIIGIGVLTASCSVGMAARTGGVKPEQIADCQSRDCFINKDSVEIMEKVALDGGGFRETYKFQLKRGSAGRAAMHGLLDVATLGVWEVVGTPIEATKNKKYIVITADYDANGRLVQKTFGTPSANEPIAAAVTGNDIQLPEGTPVVHEGKLLGVVTPEGQFIKIEDIQASTTGAGEVLENNKPDDAV